MKHIYSAIVALLFLTAMTGCTTANHTAGNSQVRQAPETYPQSNNYQQQQYGSSQPVSNPNTQTGDSSGLGSSGTGGQTGPLGSSGGSPYTPPTGGKMPANTASTSTNTKHVHTR